MTGIDVRNQVRLPLRKTFALCLRGIQYRLFRSAITVAIVALAVAFLMMMLTTSLVDRQVARDVRGQVADLRVLGEWTSKLSAPMTPERLARRLAEAQPASGDWSELRRWGGGNSPDPAQWLTDEQVACLADVARRQQVYGRYLARLNPGERTALMGSRREEELYLYLHADASGARTERFVKDTGNFSVGFPGKGQGFAEFLGDFAAGVALRQRILDGQARAVTSLAAALAAGESAATAPATAPAGRRSAVAVLELLRRADAETGEMLQHSGFYADLDALTRLAGLATLELEIRQVADLLAGSMRMRRALANKLDKSPSQLAVDEVLALAARDSGAAWLAEEVTRVRADARNEQVRAAVVADLAGRAGQRVVAALGAARAAGVSEAVEAVRRDWLKADRDPKRPTGELHRTAWDDLKKALARKDVALPEGEAGAALEAAIRSALAGASDDAVAAAQQAVAARWDRGETLEPLPVLTLAPPRIAEVAREALRQTHLTDVEGRLSSEGAEAEEAGFLGFGGRTGWLIIISFVVCVVGVANAMLMSVTERFREIATMKCLGAMDSFIMVSFVMESSLQGLAGGAAGVLLGLLLGAMRSLWGFGALALVNLPGAMLLAAAGACLVAGVVLAALAAVYPAWVAARLAPMEAMRIE